MTDTAAFRSAVETALGGGPWTVAATSTGFVATLDLDQKPGPKPSNIDEPGRLPQLFLITVTADAASNAFTIESGRSAEITTDVTQRTATGIRRDIEQRSYSGAHRTFTFSRTPGGLVPDTDSPFDTASREREIAAIGTALGLRFEGDAAGAPVASKKSMVLIIGVFAGVLLVIGVVGALVLSAVARMNN